MASRSINSVCLITQYAVSKGLSIAEVLSGTGITIDQLSDPSVQIEEAQELTALENLLPLTLDPFQLGMELGASYQLTSYGIWGYALLASPSLGKAVELGLRYVDLTYAFCDIQLQQWDNKARIVFTPKCPSPLADLVVYRDLWAMMVIPRDLFAANLPRFNVNFQGPPPTFLSERARRQLEEEFGAEVHFNQSGNYVEFDHQSLNMPLPRGNEMTVKMCEQQCQAMLDEKQRLGGVAHTIRSVMLKHGLHVSMVFVASEMAMTTRTLHRQLQLQGTNWRQLRNDIRLTMAQEWLATGRIQLDEIAERLGFSDAANFSHAFKRWQGVSPSRYRAEMGASATIK